jgi:sugar lactone lactonase YvrE
VDGQGNVLFTDHSDGSRVWVLPARSGPYYGQTMTAGDLYLIAGGGSSTTSGGPATGAYLGDSRGLALDGHGNLLLTATDPNTVRVLAAHDGTFYGQPMTAGDLYTIAGGLEAPVGLAVDSHGNVIVSLSGVRKFLDVVAARSGTFYGVPMTAGHVYPVAGGGHSLIPLNQRGSRVMLRNPEGVAVSPSGDLLLAELEAGRVLLIRG